MIELQSQSSNYLMKLGGNFYAQTNKKEQLKIGSSFKPKLVVDMMDNVHNTTVVTHVTAGYLLGPTERWKI
jgi:hypothetical protein